MIKLKCPYCDHILRLESEDFTEDGNRLECDECNNVVYIYSVVSVNYHADRLGRDKRA